MSNEFSSVQWDSDPNSPVIEPASESSNNSPAPIVPQPQPEDSAGTSTQPQQTDTVYFNCTVTDPQKEDGQNPFVSYLVKTETNSPSFQIPKVQVRRRFSDFLYLYLSLVSEFPASAVPPLPDKQRLEYIKGDRFGPEFTLRRASSLSRFLTRVSRHPVLKKSKSFYAFLESNDWNSFKKHKGDRVVSTNSEGVFDGLSDTFLNAFSKVQHQSKELNDVKARAEKLDDNLSNIEKTFARVVRHEANMVHDLEEFATQTIRLASLEPGLSQQVSEFARGIQEYSQAADKMRENIDCDYVVSLRDMNNYVNALKGLIKQREQKQLDYEALCDYLNKAQIDRNNLQAGGGTNFIRSKVEDLRGVDHEQSRQDRIRRLDVKIDDLTREVASAKVTSESFEDFAINEVAIFERVKGAEMKDSLNSLCDYNVEFYQSVVDNLTQVAEAMNKQASSSTMSSTSSPAE